MGKNKDKLGEMGYKGENRDIPKGCCERRKLPLSHTCHCFHLFKAFIYPVRQGPHICHLTIPGGIIIPFPEKENEAQEI